MGHIDGPDAMALAWMNSGGVRQMIGYTVLTWYGYAGWDCLDYFVEQPGRYTMAEAFFANQQALIHRLATYHPEGVRMQVKPGEHPTGIKLTPPSQSRRAEGPGYCRAKLGHTSRYRLSITHRFWVQIVTEEDLGESRESPPDNQIARRCIVHSTQVSAQFGHFQQVVGYGALRGCRFPARKSIQDLDLGPT